MSASVPRTGPLSLEQLRLYEDNGYVVIRNFIEKDTLERCRKRFHNVCDGTAERGEIIMVNETKINGPGGIKKDIVNKLHDIHFDNEFASYTEHPKILSVMRQLIGSELSVLSSVYINKAPGSVRHPPHQDLAYLAVRPANRVACVWTAVDPASIDKGALFMQPGSHKPGLVYEHGHVEYANKGYHSIMDKSVTETDKWVYLEMAPGDTVFFQPLLIHGSGANITQDLRRNCMTSHYGAESLYGVEVCGGPLATVANDVIRAMKHRGWKVTYENIGVSSTHGPPITGAASNYEDNGYVVIRNFIEKVTLDRCSFVRSYNNKNLKSYCKFKFFFRK